MIKILRDKWYANKDKLKQALSNDKNLRDCDYLYLVKMVITHILNDNLNEIDWNVDDITVIDHGRYQGSLLFIIHKDTYQPYPYEYLIASVYYGSCSGCDTLIKIQGWNPDNNVTESQLEDYMKLCKDIVCSIKKPYCNPWDESENDDWSEVDEGDNN